jgi:2-polyprenyl-6-methoxyphenol hydroxylase-like FAD-dependent oxidoreductase
VVVVGAGPVGLATAARLASQGVPVLVLEADPELRKQGSKACLIQGDVLEILDKFGCAQEIQDEGVTWHTARTYVRNQEIRAAVYPARPGFGPFVNISQYRIEQVLLAHVLRNPLCEVRWSHRVTSVEQDEDGVLVATETPDGSTRVRSRYLIACDGIHSVVRKATGVAWTGYTHQNEFLITDIRAKLALAKERHFHFDPSFNPGRQVVMHPQPNDIWRIDWQLAPGTDIAEERRSGAFDQRVRAVIGDVPYDIDWLSTYRFHQRVVESFQVGRVFFAGDAAHALPPYGSRGMNSGIQDADNIAWKLALVLAGWAPEDLLQTYHVERYAAARENLAVTEATIRFMVPPTRARRLIRSALLRLSLPVKSMRDRVNSGRMAEPHVYRESPIVDAETGHRLIGHFAPDGWLTTQAGRTRIRTLFGGGFVVLCFGADEMAVRRLIRDLLAHPAQMPFRTVFVMSDDVQVGDLQEQFSLVHEEDGQLRTDYSVTEPLCLIVRPDSHVAAVVRGTARDEVVSALARSSGGVNMSQEPAATNHA